MIFAISLIGGIVWFAYVALLLYAKQTPEAQIRRRLSIMIRHAEEERAKTALGNQKLQEAANTDPRGRQDFVERVVKPLLYAIEERLQKLAPAELLKMIENRIFRAGKQGVWSVRRLAAFVVVSSMAGGALAFMFIKGAQFQFSQNVIIMLSGFASGAAIPFLVLSQKIAERQRNLRRQLPEFLDLLCVSVQAGLSFDGAVSKIITRMTGLLVDEFKRVQNDVSLGMTRQYALTQMARRCDIEEIYLFTTSVIQAERLGTSMARTLKLQADNMRERHRQYVKAQALKAPVKIIFPMVFFIFPSIFVVLLFPSIMMFMKFNSP